MVLLQLCRLKFSNKETLQQTLFNWTWILFTKTTNSHFEQPFGGVRGNERTSSIARWKACGRLPIRYNWAFFISSCGWDVMSRYWSKSAFFKRVGQITLIANFRWMRTSPTNLFWYQKTRSHGKNARTDYPHLQLEFRKASADKLKLQRWY